VIVTYATRRSALALAQCRAFVARLKAAHPDLETNEKQVVTTGDRIQDRPLSEIGGKGLFVKEIEEALLDGSAHFAVHSIKDVPAELPHGLGIVCIPQREDPRDVLVSPQYGSIANLPERAKVGTSSLRRQLMLRAARPDLTFVALRGNVDTRLRKVEAGEADAIVLARAGLVRLGLQDRATEVLAPEVSLPAVGQGALGIESKLDVERIAMLLAPLHDPETATCVAAERAVLLALEGDCKTPIAAFAQKDAGFMRLRAFIANPDGSNPRTREERVSWPTEHDARIFGHQIGRELKG
jgi:hydroxymethylbilane synthase